jgi:hypothetical protein
VVDNLDLGKVCTLVHKAPPPPFLVGSLQFSRFSRTNRSFISFLSFIVLYSGHGVLPLAKPLKPLPHRGGCSYFPGRGPEAMSVNAELSSENPEKEGSARTAVRFHLGPPCGGFWDGGCRALLRTCGPHAGSNAHKRGNSPPQKPIKKGLRGLPPLYSGLAARRVAGRHRWVLLSARFSGQRLVIGGLRLGIPAAAKGFQPALNGLEQE